MKGKARIGIKHNKLKEELQAQEQKDKLRKDRYINHSCVRCSYSTVINYKKVYCPFPFTCIKELMK